MRCFFSTRHTRNTISEKPSSSRLLPFSSYYVVIYASYQINYIIIIKHNTVVHRFEVCTRVGFFISTIYRVEVIYMNEAVFRG